MSLLPARKKLTLVQKLIFSYAAMLFFTTAALVFAVVGLYSIKRTARDIIITDLPAISATLRLRESLLAQERYAGKFMILRLDEFRQLFHQREEEFHKILGDLEKKNSDETISRLSIDYHAYQQEVDRLFKAPAEAPLPARKEAEQVFADIEAVSASRQKLLFEKLAETDRREAATVRLTLLYSFAGSLLALAVAALFIHNISSSIRKLKRGTHRIAQGDFDFNLQVAPGDEFGELAEDFTRMAKKLKDLEQLSLDASPLTRLPGNIAIERLLSSKIEGEEPYAVCYADLDNFKAYNDRYGYIKASEVIKLTGDIISDTVSGIAGEGAFVGHVGGDDFVMVVPAEHAAAICENVIASFSAMIVEHYTGDDLAKGAIEGIDRYGVPRTFPIITISIAVLVCHRGEYGSPTDIAEAALEIKDRLKGMKGSNYFIYSGATAR